MITARFTKSNRNWLGFDVSGHAGLSDSGFDVACASVSSAVMLTANLITDSFNIAADVRTDENSVSLRVIEATDTSNRIVSALSEHLEHISEEFPRTIRIKISEV